MSGPRYILVPKSFFDLYMAFVDPWERELERARKQLGRFSSQRQ